MRKKAPPTASEVVRGLTAAGFARHPNKNGGSHEKWIRYEEVNGKVVKRVVIVDAHHAPFSEFLVKSMASGAGMTKKQFLEICTKEGAKQAKEGSLSWLAPAASPDA